jgi:hypothetical protein
LGEATNLTDSYQHIGALWPVILDGNGDPITSEADVENPAEYDQLRQAVSVAPNQSLAFTFRVNLPAGAAFQEKYEMAIAAEPAGAAREDLEIPRDDYDRSSWPDHFYVEGTLANPGPDLTKFVAIVVTMYDDDGHVIGLGWMYETTPLYLETGEHEFAVEVVIWELVDTLGLEVYSYKLQAFGE